MKATFLLPLALALAGCATPEYRAAQAQCAYQALQQYPVHQVQTLVSTMRPVPTPTGQTHCTTRQHGNTTDTLCEPVMRPVYQRFDEMKLVDLNEANRNALAAACTRDQCVQRHGNPSCEVK
jgi:hypothetical protein